MELTLIVLAVTFEVGTMAEEWSLVETQDGKHQLVEAGLGSLGEGQLEQVDGDYDLENADYRLSRGHPVKCSHKCQSNGLCRTDWSQGDRWSSVSGYGICDSDTGPCHGVPRACGNCKQKAKCAPPKAETTCSYSCRGQTCRVNWETKKGFQRMRGYAECAPIRWGGRCDSRIPAKCGNCHQHKKCS